MFTGSRAPYVRTRASEVSGNTNTHGLSPPDTVAMTPRDRVSTCGSAAARIARTRSIHSPFGTMAHEFQQFVPEQLQ
jgi:hypothetical protein